MLGRTLPRDEAGISVRALDSALFGGVRLPFAGGT
jgi:hypothetical protein